jgi:hypothetical protein
MSFATDTFARGAFKRLNALAHTSSDRDPANESILSAPILELDKLISEAIDNSQAQAVTDGTVEVVTFDMTEVSGSNSKAYEATFPAGYSGHFGVGAAGQLMRDYSVAIPKTFSSPVLDVDSDGYNPILKNAGATKIADTDACDWYWDETAGIAVCEDPSAGGTNWPPATMKAAIYTRTKLAPTEHISLTETSESVGKLINLYKINYDLSTGNKSVVSINVFASTPTSVPTDAFVATYSNAFLNHSSGTNAGDVVGYIGLAGLLTPNATSTGAVVGGRFQCLSQGADAGSLIGLQTLVNQSGGGTIPVAVGLHLTPNVMGGAVVQDCYNALVQAHTGSAITNAYGLRFEEQTAGSLNHTIHLEGSAGIHFNDDDDVAIYSNADHELTVKALNKIHLTTTTVIADSASKSPLNVTERSVEPSAPAAGDIYLDDGTNTASGNPGWRRCVSTGPSVWEDISAGAGGSGETNTASNVGTNGVGVFDGKVGVDLQFRHVASTTDRITVALDAIDNDVDVTLVEGNVVHQNLSGAGTNTHIQIDTHIADSTIHLTAHALLDPTVHTDVQTLIAPTQGDIILANATPKWDVLAIGSATRYLRSNGTTATWTLLGIVDDTSPQLGGNLDCQTRYLELDEQSAPASPAANHARLYAKDNGGGVTHLYYKDSADTESRVGNSARRAGFHVINPVVGDIFFIADIPATSTTTHIHGKVLNGTNLTFKVWKVNRTNIFDPVGSGTAIITAGTVAVATGTGTEDTSFDSPAIAADDSLYGEVTAVTGAVDELRGSVTTTVD